MPPRPLCFVIMPFGQKKDPAGGGDIDFDRIYKEALEPAIQAVGMDPIRADEERVGGIIHKPMFERLLLCDFAIADLTTANANVFYELGVRHAARPSTTLTLFARKQPIPFDLTYLRSLPYDLGKKNSFGAAQADALREAVTKQLGELREAAMARAPVDSPVFQLLADWQPGPLAHDKTDSFREVARQNEEYKRRLAEIRVRHLDAATRANAHDELRAFRAELGQLDTVEAVTAVDLYLTYRALEDWDGMISLYEALPETLKRQVLVREQLGFALNRRAGQKKSKEDRAKALQVLTDLAEQFGPSAETLGLIGRIHKDQWKEAVAQGDDIAAIGHLERAIDAYRRGFLADQRDAYPGVNLLTLLDCEGSAESLGERDRLLPVVRFAVERRLAGQSPNYWDHATMLELAILQGDAVDAERHLARAVAAIGATWEPKTTSDNFRLIERARSARGQNTDWLRKIIDELDRRAAG